jgi:hypothetical protein
METLVEISGFYGPLTMWVVGLAAGDNPIKESRPRVRKQIIEVVVDCHVNLKPDCYVFSFSILVL